MLLPKYPHSGLYFSVAKIGPIVVNNLEKELGVENDSSCIDTSLDAPMDARYQVTFKLKFELGNVSANPTPHITTD